MLKTHDAIVAGSPRFSASILTEFYHIYKITRRVEPDDKQWNIDTRVDIAYTYVFYGLSMESRLALARYGDHKVKLVHDSVARLRDRGGEKFKTWFKGRQDNLSHYMRNLFSMFTLIQQSDLSNLEKKQLGKIVRTKLSNYDQAVLALNVISHLGTAWENEGLIAQFKPFANVPEHFFGYDERLHLKTRFPTINFEWETRPGYRPTYRYMRIGALHAVWHREWYNAT